MGHPSYLILPAPLTIFHEITFTQVLSVPGTLLSPIITESKNIGARCQCLPPLSGCPHLPVLHSGRNKWSLWQYLSCGNFEQLCALHLSGSRPTSQFRPILTWKICFRLCSEGIGRHSMLKCRMKRGVTGLRPPPGGAHADAMVTSCVGRNSLKSPSWEREMWSTHPNSRTHNPHSRAPAICQHCQFPAYLMT